MGEIQLTDALARTGHHADRNKAAAFVAWYLTGSRYDTGDKLSYLQAVITLASEREDIGPELTDWLHKFCLREIARD